MKNTLKNLQLLLILLLVFSCSPKIRTITAFENKNKILEKRFETVFDKKGNELKEITYGKMYNLIKTTTYDKKGKVSILKCDLQKDSNTCILNFLSKFSFNLQDKTETETMYVKDSLIWLIRERRFENRLTIVKTYSWEDEATKIPNYNVAFIITDSLQYDTKNRLIKVVSYSKIHEKPFVDLYKYTKNGYSYQIMGTRLDTIYNFIYTKEQKKIRKKIPHYQFYYPKELIYKIEYY